jgi:hypothetical protein
VEAEVGETAQRILPADAWLQVERHDLARIGLRRRDPAVQRQHHARPIERDEVLRLGLVAPEAEQTRITVGVAGDRAADETAARRMSRIIASIGRHADLGVREGRLVMPEHRVAREQLPHRGSSVPEEAAGLEDGRRQQADAAVDIDPFDRAQRRIADDVFRLQPIVAFVRPGRGWPFAVERNLREVLKSALAAEQQTAAHELGQFDARLRHLVAMP